MIRTKESLSELITSKKFIPYVEGAVDDRHEKIRWTMLGDCRYNLLWIIVINIATGAQAIECIKSLLPTPMKDRTDGFDPVDAELAQTHTNDMWVKYKDRLTK